MGAHVKCNCIFSQFNRLNEHRGHQIFARHEPVMLRAKHFQLQESIIELKLKKLMTHCLVVDKVNQGIKDLGEPTFKMFISVIDANLLFNQIRRLQVLCINFLLRVFARNLHIFAAILLFSQRFYAIQRKRPFICHFRFLFILIGQFIKLPDQAILRHIIMLDLHHGPLILIP